MDFAVLAHHGVKLNETEIKNNNVDLASELKKLWNMKELFIQL